MTSALGEELTLWSESELDAGDVTSLPSGVCDYWSSTPVSTPTTDPSLSGLPLIELAKPESKLRNSICDN